MTEAAPDGAGERAAYPRLDPADLATTLATLGMLHELAPDDPDIQTIKRAAGVMTSRIRKARRREAREAAMAPGREHDKRVLESTATGSPERIDDETRGIPLAAQGD